MANRFWVGGNGTWDTISTANWSATSGGAAGASTPTSADAVIFDASSGGGTATIGANVPALTLTMTGYTGTLAFGTNKISLHGNATTIYTGATTFSVSGTPLIDCVYAGATGTRTLNCTAATEANSISFNITAGTDSFLFTGNVKNIDYTGFAGTYLVGTTTRRVFGNFKLPSGLAGVTTGTALLVFAATSGPKTIQTSGNLIDGDVSFAGVGGSWSLVDNLSIGSTKTFYLGDGTFLANDKNVTIGNFALSAGTKTLTLGSGTWTVNGTSWNANTNVANLTVSASSGIINMASGSAKAFAGGAKTWPTLNQGGSGALTIQQSNTFSSITNTIRPATITFTSGTTQTVTSFPVAGVSGSLITLNASTPGSAATISDADGVNRLWYCSITDLTFTGGAIWRAPLSGGNVDGGGDSGISFISGGYIYSRRKNKVI